MLRRILSLILVPALLANQAVLCCAHSHDGSARTQQAHIHYSGHSHESGHHHHHDNHGHHHDQSKSSFETPGDHHVQVSLNTNEPEGHDHDAIYVSGQTDWLIPSSRTSVGASKIVVHWSPPIRPVVAESRHVCIQSRAGPLGLYSADQCALFLQTCCLLI